jgi:hypothetical protein
MYLWVITLLKIDKMGGSLDKLKVSQGLGLQLGMSLNPGRRNLIQHFSSASL